MTGSGGGKGGLPFALGAYTLWGLLPLYLVLLNPVDPFEVVAWRILWTLPLCLVLVVVTRQVDGMRRALGDPRTLGLLLASSVLIGLNWLTYIFAVQRGQFYAASLAYYLNPLLNVLIGTVLLKERLSTLQWLAVALAAVAVALLVNAAGATLLITLTLAFSFAFYGYIRKTARVEALPGLTIESLLLTLPAIGLLALAPFKQATFGDGLAISALLVGAGPMTAIPLLLFAVAARRMDYSTLGFVQFLAPTIVFFTGLFVFKQPMDDAQLACFVLIWIAIALFTADILARRRQRAAAKRSGSPIA